jgi:hypothetical protein
VPETDWAEERDKNILSIVYYCETCNQIIEPGDVDIARHKEELRHHKMRRVAILRCSVCGNVTTDSYAEYSPERNQFWCLNCIIDLGHEQFHTSPSHHLPDRDPSKDMSPEPM